MPSKNSLPIKSIGPIISNVVAIWLHMIMIIYNAAYIQLASCFLQPGCFVASYFCENTQMLVISKY